MIRVDAVAADRRLPKFLLALIWIVVAAILHAGPFSAAAQAQGTIPQLPAWLEPRMLSIVDMVGFAPESTLQNAIITYSTAGGILYYVSGTRLYDEVEIHVRITPRYSEAGPATYTQVGCLGQTAVFDQWPSAAPASKMRLYEGDQEITPAIYWMSVIPAGLVHPQGNSTTYYRYAYDSGTFVQPTTPLSIPANMGCALLIPGRHTNLTAVFTLRSPAYIRATHLASESFAARSYVGEGAAGVLGPLNEQMQQRFGIRHDKFTLAPPAGADYALITFPPTPLDPYAAVFPANAGLEGSGTYRFERPGSLSVDHVNSLPIPLQGHWRDVDPPTQPADFLPYYRDWQRISAPEYFLPPGIPFDVCMSSGGCSEAILNSVNDARFPVIVHYFRVDRLPGSDLVRVPLQQVGATWGALFTSSEPNREAEVAPAAQQQAIPTYLPWISNLRSGPLPPDDASGCPFGCGWFDAIGRMYDVILPP